MLDLLLGGALRVHYHLSYTREDSRILSGIAKAEGIDIDQFRADLEKPVDATPVKRPTLSLKKKPSPSAAWPFPTQKKALVQHEPITFNSKSNRNQMHDAANSGQPIALLYEQRQAAMVQSLLPIKPKDHRKKSALHRLCATM
jgi:hypothetical protein